MFNKANIKNRWKFCILLFPKTRRSLGFDLIKVCLLLICAVLTKFLHWKFNLIKFTQKLFVANIDGLMLVLSTPNWKLSPVYMLKIIINFKKKYI